MLTTLLAVLPIFATIFTGWGARRIGVLGEAATTELNRFVVFLALPALLFDVTAHAHWNEIWKPGFIAVFGLSSLASFGVTVLFRTVWEGRPLADAAVDGLNASYSNTGFMGFPLALVAFGREALAPTTVAAIMTVCGVFAAAIVLIETGMRGQTQEGRRHGGVWRSVLRSLFATPLLVAPAFGFLISLAGVPLTAPVESFMKALSGTASPCALIALGMFLARRREGGFRSGPVALLVGLKLFAHPALAYLLGRHLFDLPPLLLHVAVLMAALPTGTGPFMLAEFYRREADLSSLVVLISTVLSVFTVAAYLAVV